MADVSRGTRRRNAGIANPVINARPLRALFIKAALTYGRTIPISVRRCIEFTVLMKALCTFALLIYIHIIFLRSPATCLDKVRSTWPRDGILRVEIIKEELLKNKNLAPFNLNESLIDIQPSSALDLLLKDSKKCQTLLKSNISIDDCLNEMNLVKEISRTFINYDEISIKPRNTNFINENLIKTLPSDNSYIAEYSSEYGLLQLSPAKIKKLKIPIMTVRLDPTSDTCFGNNFSRLILGELVGYEDLILSSLKILAENEDTKGGYMRNVITGKEYSVNLRMLRTGYIGVFFICMIFTMILLLQRSFMVQIISNATIGFRATSLLTQFLALVGYAMLLILYLDDATKFFYIFLIVLIADKYYDVCCFTYITRKYWLRFLYLYYFVFFTYYYRFNGQHSSLALATTWFFIEHSMIFFFHHYELPIILIQNSN